MFRAMGAKIKEKLLKKLIVKVYEEIISIFKVFILTILTGSLQKSTSTHKQNYF